MSAQIQLRETRRAFPAAILQRTVILAEIQMDGDGKFSKVTI